MRDSLHGKEDFAYAIDSYGSSVYRLAYSLLRSRQNAEDIYQEVFTNLYTSSKEFENDYHLKSWLMKSTSNRCKNFKRDLARRQETASDMQDDAINAEAIVATHQNAEQYEYVWDVVDQLSENLRSVIYLHYVEGYSTEQIAEITDISAATVRTRLFRARSKIKVVLEGGES